MGNTKITKKFKITNAETKNEIKMNWSFKIYPSSLKKLQILAKFQKTDVSKLITKYLDNLLEENKELIEKIIEINAKHEAELKKLF